MMENPNRDLYPTTTIRVPNLIPLLERIRSQDRRRVITLLHVRSAEEGEWICATAAARLARGQHAKILGPESLKPLDMIERAIRGSAKVVFAGEIRYEEDARAMRAAATLGIRPVGYIVREKRKEAENLMTLLGPWNSFDTELLGTYN
jgi:hypothetical protein